MKPIKFEFRLEKGVTINFINVPKKDTKCFSNGEIVRVTIRKIKVRRKLTDRQKQIIHDVIMAVLGALVALSAAILW